MPFTTDVRRHLKPVGQTHTTNPTQRRVGPFRWSGINAGTDTALLRVALQSRHIAPLNLTFSRLTNQLVDRCHENKLQKYSTPSPGGQIKGEIGRAHA